MVKKINKIVYTGPAVILTLPAKLVTAGTRINYARKINPKEKRKYEPAPLHLFPLHASPPPSPLIDLSQ